MKTISRRDALVTLAAITVGAGAAMLWRWSATRPYDRMRADFAEGRVLSIDGWFLSSYEVEALRLNDARNAATTMTVRDLRSDGDSRVEYDVCVVGSGPAGLAVAEALAAEGLTGSVC